MYILQHLINYTLSYFRQVIAYPQHTITHEWILTSNWSCHILIIEINAIPLEIKHNMPISRQLAASIDLYDEYPPIIARSLNRHTWPT